MVSSQSKNSKKKELAKESLKIKKSREKLKKRLETMEAKMTREAIDKKSIEIHRWISRHADRRIALRDKAISLFDENQNAVGISERISKIAEKIHTGKYSE